VDRSSKIVRGKKKGQTTKARVKRRAVPERVRSHQRVEDVTRPSGDYRTGASRDNAGPQARETVVLATNSASKMNDQSGRSDLPQRPDSAPTTTIYPQATATALAALEAWFLLPLRTWQSWQGAWARLLLR
jgi:hypothetical protein